MKNKAVITNKDNKNMEDFLSFVLNDYKTGEITKKQAVECLAHVMVALDSGNYDEARSWFEQGRKFICR